jgi:RNA polymerase primary sigma factor
LRAPPPHSRELGDLPLVEAVIAGRQGAWAELLRRTSDSIYNLAVAVFGEADADDEYLHLLALVSRDRFALLREFDGRSRLTVFLRFRLGDVLADRVLGLFGQDDSRAWRAFEGLYGQDIKRLIARYFVGRGADGAVADGLDREDLYQEICCLLVADGYRRIRAFDGRGSFSAYARRVIRNLCIDLQRKARGRRRLPESVRRLPPLEQEAFRLVFWSGARPEAVEAMLASAGPHTPDRVHTAIARISDLAAGKAAPQAASPQEPRATAGDVADARPSPERALIEAEAEGAHQAALEALSRAVGQLPSDAQLYVRLRFYTTPPKAPREIARLMGRAPEEIYRLRERTLVTLRAVLDASGKLSPVVRLAIETETR